MKEGNMTRADFITSIFLMVFGVTTLVISLRMPTFAATGANPYSAPGVVPGILGVFLALFGIILFVRSVRNRGYLLGINRSSFKAFFTSIETVRLFATMIVSVIYAIVLLGRTPYPLATGVYVLVFVLMFEYDIKVPFAKQLKKVVLALILAVLTAALVTVVFEYLFLVELPG